MAINSSVHEPTLRSWLIRHGYKLSKSRRTGGYAVLWYSQDADAWVYEDGDNYSLTLDDVAEFRRELELELELEAL